MRRGGRHVGALWRVPPAVPPVRRSTFRPMRAPITLVLHITNFNYPDTPAERLFDRVAEIATTAEESGFSSISVMDHLHQIPVVGPEHHWMLEGNVALAALATRTRRVSLGLLVGGVTYRNPALHGKMTTTLDMV